MIKSTNIIADWFSRFYWQNGLICFRSWPFIKHLNILIDFSWVGVKILRFFCKYLIKAGLAYWFKKTHSFKISWNTFGQTDINLFFRKYSVQNIKLSSPSSLHILCLSLQISGKGSRPRPAPSPIYSSTCRLLTRRIEEIRNCNTFEIYFQKFKTLDYPLHRNAYFIFSSCSWTSYVRRMGR